MQIKNIIDNIAANNNDTLARATDGLGPDYDYGLAAKLAQDGRGHLGDVGKLPWHPTFSQESAYSNSKVPGGVWTDVGFRPSVQMVSDGRTQGLAAYMAQAEPSSKLLTPIPMNKKYFQEKVK